MRATVIAIDGPAGSGKSTLARRLASQLGLAYINTGLMYRALTARALMDSVDPDDGPALAALATHLDFSLEGTAPRVLSIGGAGTADGFVSSEVEAAVSRVARHPQVRAFLREEQRRLGSMGAVLEGRDIGTVVFPDADLKIYLDADVSERIRRRSLEREEADERLARSLTRRDEADAKVNPFVPAPDAVVVDTDALDADAVMALVLSIAQERSLTGPQRSP